MTRSAHRRGVIPTLVGLLALLLLGAGPAVGSLPSQSVTPGGDYCETDEGVTVVVDMTVFDKGIIVRCVDGSLPSSYTGWDALVDAGFSPEAPARQPGFLCRVAGEPSASRALSIPGDEDYHEQCVVTPPDSAYWAYWHAPNGGNWTYSDFGAASRDVIEGGFEGFSFALNGSIVTPGVAPVRLSDTPDPPPTSPPAPTATPSPTTTPKPTATPSPTATPKPTATPSRTAIPSPTATPKPPAAPSPTAKPKPTATTKPAPSPTSGGASTPLGDSTPTQPDSATTPSPSGESSVAPRGQRSGASGKDDGTSKGRQQNRGKGQGDNPPAATEAPTTPAETDDGVVVTGEVPSAADDAQDDGSPASLLIGLGLLAVLAAGAGLTAWRRSRA